MIEFLIESHENVKIWSHFFTCESFSLFIKNWKLSIYFKKSLSSIICHKRVFVNQLSLLYGANGSCFLCANNTVVYESFYCHLQHILNLNIGLILHVICRPFNKVENGFFHSHQMED
jgi:hypothetical protein